MKINRILFLLPFLVLCSCRSAEGEGRVVKKGDKIVVIPAEYTEPFRNPMMGLRDVFSVGLDPVPADYPLPFGSMYKEYIPWDRIERTESDGVEQVIAYCNHRWEGIEEKNIKVIPRVYVHWLGTPAVKDPDSLDGVRFPADLQWGMKEGDPYPMQGGYFDPSFKDRVRKLVAKLGEAWDNDPRVAYVEMGIIGQWGEHHSPMLSPYWKPHDAPYHTDNVTWIPGMSEVLGDAFKAAFKNKKVMGLFSATISQEVMTVSWMYQRDEVEITDDLGDYLLKAGKVTKEEYDERQAQARELLAAGRSGSV